MKLRNKKTGEILEDVKYIDTSLTTIEIYYLDNGVLRIETEKDYHSFLQNWEDYDKPKDPLIRDEKIRKAVRAWAEVNGIEAVEIVSKYQLISLDEQCSIEFFAEICPEYVHNEEHTIAELCGEDEE